MGPREVVFFNGFLDSSSLCALKISASSVELGSRDDFGSAATLFSLTVSVSAVACPEDFIVRRRTGFRGLF